MKMKRLILGLALGSFFLGGCNDDLSLVGPSIQPEADKVRAFTDTFEVEMSTIKLDSVYARTVSGLLGELYDPLYGNIKADYICQFYCPENYKFSHEPIEGKVDSMAFFILYQRDTKGNISSSCIGDTLAPMQARIYKVTKPLERNYYTNMNAADYCDMETLLGEKTYTPRDLSISDSIRSITSATDNNYYTPNVRIRISTDLAQAFYDETVNNPQSFKNQDTFNQFFPGFYVTTGYGTGNILKVAQSSFFIYYKYMSKTSAGKDTIINTREQFNVTKEVIQMNQVKNDNLEALLEPNEEYSYMKTPSGVCTKIVVPAKTIQEKIGTRILNDFRFKLKAMPQEKWKYSFEAPSTVLLMPQDSMKNFFEKNKMSDNVTAFRGDYDSDTRTYDFGNISNVLQMHMINNPDKDMELLVIPIYCATTTAASSGYWNSGTTTTTTTTSMSNYLSPSGVKLKKDKEARQIVIVTSEYNKEK